eukprot:scaffold2215_cov353-Prasinococcus_capsulatus_cf.AAC.2
MSQQAVAHRRLLATALELEPLARLSSDALIRAMDKHASSHGVFSADGQPHPARRCAVAGKTDV